MRPTWPKVSNIVSRTRCLDSYIPARAGSTVLFVSNDGCNVAPVAPWDQYHHGHSKPKNDVEWQQPHKNA